MAVHMKGTSRWSGLVFIVLFMVSAASSAADEEVASIVVTDGELTISEGELRYIYENAAPQIRSQLELNTISRYQIIGETIASKRILKNLTALKEEDPNGYFALQFRLLNAAREFDEKRFQRELALPNFEDLAKETYRVSKEEIANRPERRHIAHILLLCSDGCDEDVKRSELKAIGDRLAAGEVFSDLAITYSEDPGSRQRGGRLSRSISRNDENVDETFRQTAFAIENVGDVSNIVRSRFGFHLMRLEEVEPAREYTFEEVKEPLMEEVERRYREDAYRDYLLSLGPTEALVIDGNVVDSIMGPLSD